MLEEEEEEEEEGDNACGGWAAGGPCSYTRSSAYEKSNEMVLHMALQFSMERQRRHSKKMFFFIFNSILLSDLFSFVK